MNRAEQQYLDIIKDILDNGIWKDPARDGMPCTKELFFKTMTFDLSEGYPLFTTKQMAWKTCLTELTWFLKGDTNIKYLVENGCKIWNDDAYKYYKRKGGYLTKEAWLTCVTCDDNLRDIIVGNRDDKLKSYTYGDLGRVYGAQWRKYGIHNFDQVQYVIDNIKQNPTSRYNIINAWNGDEFLSEYADIALPACHVYYQFCVNSDKLDVMVLQRSCDMFLGVPFDIASAAALLMIIAHHTGYKPGKVNWVGNCCHLYENHIEQAKELISREPYEFPTLDINWKTDIGDYLKTDFELNNYTYHPRIVAPLSVGN
jgi:thymidylate synthase